MESDQFEINDENSQKGESEQSIQTRLVMSDGTVHLKILGLTQQIHITRSVIITGHDQLWTLLSYVLSTIFSVSILQLLGRHDYWLNGHILQLLAVFRHSVIACSIQS